MTMLALRHNLLCTDTETVASLSLFSMFCAYTLTSQATTTPLVAELLVLFMLSLNAKDDLVPNEAYTCYYR